MREGQAKQSGDGTSCPTRNQERPFALVESDNLPSGDCYVGTIEPDGSIRIRGLFEGASGNVYACNAKSDDPREGASTPPTVRIVNGIGGQTGQVTVLQPDGSYRRFSRWDRITQGSPAKPDAILRTLPQCGCGGSIGMPKLFDSFAEMSAYFLCTFAIRDA